MKKFPLLLLAISVSIGASAAPLFRNPLPVGAGIDQFDVMDEGDFNGDGHKDVLVLRSHEASRTISVILANGTGPFAAPVLTTIDTAYSPYELAIGDVNEDGKTDLVLVDSVQRMFSVMFGNGDGSFTQGPSFPGNTGVVGPLALADFNGDQNLDVAAGTFGAPTMNRRDLEIHFGNGAGSFSGSVVLHPDSVGDLQPLDINADGKTDLLVGGLIYLGNGSGGLTLTSGTNSGKIATGDFNHDGKLDLAVANGQTSAWYVEVWLGNGDGTLTSGARYSCGYSPTDIEAADVDSDGNLDLLAASPTSVTMLRGKPDGTFHAPETWVGGATSYSIITGDFDRDGKIDFVASGYDNDLEQVSRVAFVRGNGDGTFRTSRIRHTGSVVPVSYPGLGLIGGRIADMNGDDHPDVVIGQNKPAPDVNNSDFGVLLNDGAGRLAAPILTNAGIPMGPFAIGDVNNDDKVDIVTVAAPFSTPIPRTFLGNGDGTFATPITLGVSNAGAVFLGHFNGDANLDLFVHSHHFAILYPGNGNGTFGTGTRSDFNTGLSAMTGDLNGDGKMDWIGSTVYSKIAFSNDGNGNFTSHQISTMDFEPVAIADFNSDGKADLLVTSYIGTETWLGNGDGTFAPAIQFTITPKPGGPGVAADFDGDGKLDVALGTSIFLGNGDGRFRSRARAHVLSLGRIDVDDMDGNGSPDLVGIKYYEDDVFVLLTRTTSDPTAPSSVALSSDQATGQYGRGITFTATVTGGLIPLTGAVTFFVDGTPQAIAALDREGKATFTTAFTVGSHNVTATYAGDENYVTSSNSMTQSVAKGQPVATISGWPNPRAARQLVTITVDVYAQRFSNFAAPTGALTLRDGNTPLNLTITNNKATTRDLSVGSHVISVDYPGDANYEPATASYTQVITKPVPTVIVATAPQSPIYAGSQVTFRATFYSITNITGTITFILNDIVQATVPLSNGAAELPLTLPWGHYRMQAQYSGDDTWAAALGYLDTDVLIGPWGTPPSVDATGFGSGSVHIRWAKVTGGVTYTLWRKKTLLGPWEQLQNFGTNMHEMSWPMEQGKTWMFAATVTDANGNVSPMGPPDLATAVTFTDATLAKIKAAHVTELRSAINSVRTFAGLTPYSYTNTIAAGQRIRTSDIQEMRTALAQARSTIGLPAISFVDPTLTPFATLVRSPHIGQLRAGTN